jgi:hypothetical protein
MGYEETSKEERLRIRRANMASFRAFVASLGTRHVPQPYQPPRMAQQEHWSWRRGPERRQTRGRNWW